MGNSRITNDFIQLPLGIFDKSENRTAELIEIMEKLHSYVPGARGTDQLEDVLDREPKFGQMRPIPLGGDQLTCERIRGAHNALVQQDTPEERLEGLFSMVEDFHEKMNFLQVIVDKFYKTTSGRECGTLYQLRTVLNRRNVSTDVSQRYHAVADFVDFMTECHVLAAAMTHLSLTDKDQRPALFPRGIDVMPLERRKVHLNHIVSEIVDRFIFHTLSENLDSLQDGALDKISHTPEDNVFQYATNFMTFGLLRKVSLMTTASGDGDRAVRNWKFSLLAYHDTHKIKYRLEAFLLLSSMSTLLPPRLAEQVKWGRFVNLSGGPGKNLDGDEVMEHLNRLAKDRIKSLGPNHTPEVVMRIGKTIMFTKDVTQRMGVQTSVPPMSREHKEQQLEKDRTVVLKQLLEDGRVFQVTPGRQHFTFGQQPATVFSDIDAVELHRWLSAKKVEYSRDKWPF